MAGPVIAQQAPKQPSVEQNKSLTKETSASLLDDGARVSTNNEVQASAKMSKTLNATLTKIGVDPKKAEKITSNLDENSQKKLSENVDSIRANENRIQALVNDLNTLPSDKSVQIIKEVTSKPNSTIESLEKEIRKEVDKQLEERAKILQEKKEQQEREKERSLERVLRRSGIKNGATNLEESLSEAKKDLPKECKKHFATIQDKWNQQATTDQEMLELQHSILTELATLPKELLQDKKVMKQLAELSNEENIAPELRARHAIIFKDIISTLSEHRNQNQGNRQTCVVHSSIAKVIDEAITTGDTTSVQNLLNLTTESLQTPNCSALKDTSYIDASKNQKGYIMVAAVSGKAFEDFTKEGVNIKDGKTYEGATDKDIANIYKVATGREPVVIKQEELSKLSPEKLQKFLTLNDGSFVAQMEMEDGSLHAMLVTGCIPLKDKDGNVIKDKDGNVKYTVTFANSQSIENGNKVVALDFDVFMKNVKLIFADDAMGLKTVSIDELSDDPGKSKYRPDAPFRGRGSNSASEGDNGSLDYGGDLGVYNENHIRLITRYGGMLEEDCTQMGIDGTGIGFATGVR